MKEGSTGLHHKTGDERDDEGWHLESWEDDEEVKEDDVAPCDAFPEDWAVMVVFPYAFVAPNAVLARPHLINRTRHAEISLFVVGVVLVLE